MGHWDNVWTSRDADNVSWVQTTPTVSLEIIDGLDHPGKRAIDIGAGASTLADHLLERGFQVTALDISHHALAHLRHRLGPQIDYHVGDARDPPAGPFHLWHDRAVFHFLTEPDDQATYMDTMADRIPTGGHAIIATFAPDGPTQCSGLPVARHDHHGIARLAHGFTVIDHYDEAHTTPWGSQQAFQYTVLQRD